MGASAGYGLAVHNGKCAMHKLGIQVLPSPSMMAIMGCKVAMLSIGSEEMLAYYTAMAFATGFMKSLALQLRGIKRNRSSSTKRQPGSSCTSPDVEAFMGSKDTFCKVAMLNIGLEDMLAHFTVAPGFKKMLAFQLRGIKQSRQARACGSPQGLEDTFAHCTMKESAAGFKRCSDILGILTV
ncbi:hypothetical protein AK812_SmicGene30701 [Symbiodinium microadriaticum]|uniref:Uncharacterized protein n=1 Tax=Symbiodinium microadriaticum TaxID=2951 RepID=A0A1Q9CYP2_SYMMI|nr:hypothetical protein AK812_SmicGene30701 [Symbiodinium microadriaticum]